MAVMSFAFLKDKKNIKEEKPAGTLPVVEPARTTYRIPSVMETALLVSVNYCQSRGRFLPASEWEKGNGNPYGFFLGDDSYQQHGQRKCRGCCHREAVEATDQVVFMCARGSQLSECGASSCWRLMLRS